jgi:GntR family transcriptional regulator, rspAB operon transcriptional repressor
MSTEPIPRHGRAAARQRFAEARASAISLSERADVDRASPIPEQVYRILRQAILTLRMPPGAVIVEKEITERLGISRTPLRDAIRQLADERLVEIRPQSGTYVALIDRHQLEQGRLIRRALEVEGIRLAARRADDAAIERLQDIIALQERAASRGRHEEFIAQDDAFHRFISALSGYERLWPIVNGSKAHLDRVRHLSSPLPRQEATAIAQHKAIVKALAGGKPERAAKAMTHHLDDAYARLSLVLKQHAALFG